MAGPDALTIDNPALAHQAELLARPPTQAWHMADAIRALAIDAVEAAKSGHPGMPMGMADVATALWTRFHKFDAADPRWPDRDRFVLSAGHGSMLLYALLHLTGHAGMTIDDIKRFRQLEFPGRRSSGIRRAPGHRDHHRPARPGHRHRGRHGAGRAHAGRPVRPLAGRSPHLGDRLRRRPDGGHQPRGDRPRRPSAAVQADRALRRQPHLDRRRHRAGGLGRRDEAVRRVWLGDQAGRRARPAADHRRAVLRDALEEADADRLPHHHRLRRADQGRHRGGARLGARRRRRRRGRRRRSAGTSRRSPCRTTLQERWQRRRQPRAPPAAAPG